MVDDEFEGTEDFGNEEEHHEESNDEIVRVRLPRDREVLGIVEQRLGASKMRVRCMDGKLRICSIPGSKKKNLWIREGDTVLVNPWVLSKDTKGDVIYKYKLNQAQVLKKRGLLQDVKGSNEF